MSIGAFTSARTQTFGAAAKYGSSRAPRVAHLLRHCGHASTVFILLLQHVITTTAQPSPRDACGPQLMCSARLLRRHVILPKELGKLIIKNKLLTESEWRGVGVQQSRGWEHYAIHRYALRLAPRSRQTAQASTDTFISLRTHRPADPNLTSSSSADPSVVTP